jgi:hypothetical protein
MQTIRDNTSDRDILHVAWKELKLIIKLSISGVDTHAVVLVLGREFREDFSTLFLDCCSVCQSSCSLEYKPCRACFWSSEMGEMCPFDKRFDRRPCSTLLSSV